jgi:hypothetical protein
MTEMFKKFEENEAKFNMVLHSRHLADKKYKIIKVGSVQRYADDEVQKSYINFVNAVLAALKRKK